MPLARGRLPSPASSHRRRPDLPHRPHQRAERHGQADATAPCHARRCAGPDPPYRFPDQQATPTTLAGQRWHRTLAELAPRLVTDPHFPALAAALDRVELAGVDVTASLAAATTEPLPDVHTARALHYQLIDLCPAACTPYTQLAGPPAIPARTLAERTPGTALAAPRIPSGPSARR